MHSGKLSKKYQALVNDVDFTKKLKLSSAFNYFQEIASLHAEQLGVGFTAIKENNDVAWVVARMRVDMIRYPSWDEEITVETWPQYPKKYEFERDYIMKDSQGNILARGVSVWMILDINTRSIKKTDTLSIDYPKLDTKRAIDCTLGKLKPFGDPQIAYERSIGYSDIDFNGHLNNSKYIDFIMDCFNMEEHQKYETKSIQVNYLNEAFAGDTIILYKDIATSENGKVYIEGVKQKDGCPLFKALLTYNPVEKTY